MTIRIYNETHRTFVTLDDTNVGDTSPSDQVMALYDALCPDSDECKCRSLFSAFLTDAGESVFAHYGADNTVTMWGPVGRDAFAIPDDAAEIYPELE